MAQFIPNASEQETVNKLREQLVDVSDWQDIQQDAFLLKWLKAKDMDFEKTKAGLLECYKFRKEAGLDTILKDYTPDPELEKLFPYDITGYDKEGCPIVCTEVLPHNPKVIIKKYGKDALIKFGDYNLEKIAQACRDIHKPEKPIQQIIVICDAKKFTFKQMTSPGATELALDQLKRIEPNYPDDVKLICVVNAPKVAKLAYKIVKPFVNEKTIKNIKLFPKCNAKVKNFLLQYIDINELPQKYGGNKKIGGSADPNLLNDDEDISGNPDDLEEHEDMIEVKVPSGKKIKLEYQVDVAKTQICWSFQTDDRDIGFSVYLGEKEEIIVPYEKFQSLALQNNSITCEKTGKYTLCFNNKENRFRSVSLNYIVSVFPPGTDDD
ncbi:retinal-binding protein [Folsomia candida]|uniref:SEC14-like protein 2 n=1 Tax=Folsomia candida TaxID=158441 RepID=A0A226F2X5_FOLCA|nr:retinal-binding protein [Folsomia candida]OXA63764.1 hypothetical protein Fcan01_02698 [Folsomia candida]